jgi:hypothetical protein
MVKAINFKNWCLDNISPQSWSRIVLKTVPELRESGIDWKDIENPSDDMELDEKTINILKGGLDQIYQMQVETESLQ